MANFKNHYYEVLSITAENEGVTKKRVETKVRGLLALLMVDNRKLDIIFWLTLSFFRVIPHTFKSTISLQTL